MKGFLTTVLFSIAIATSLIGVAQSQSISNSEMESVLSPSNTQLPIEISAPSSVICNGRAIQLFSNLQEGDDFSWEPKEAFLNPESRNPWVTVNESVEVSLVVKRGDNITVKKLQLTAESIKANVSFSPEQGAVPLSIQFENKSSNATSFLWDFGHTQSTERNPQITFREPGSHSILLIAEGALGCKDTVRSQLKVHEKPKFFIPTTFTPNYDGLNETFGIVSKNVKKFHCEIFDSRGQNIFSIENQDELWDGTVNGYPAPLGSYVYRIEYSDLSGENHKLVGSVELRR